MDLNALQVVEDVPAASKRIRSRKFRICMKKLLSLPVVDHAARDELLALGVDGNDADNYMLITLAVFKKAAGGDLKFIQELRQIVCDNETEIDRKTGIAQLDRSGRRPRKFVASSPLPTTAARSIWPNSSTCCGSRLIAMIPQTKNREVRIFEETDRRIQISEVLAQAVENYELVARLFPLFRL